MERSLEYHAQSIFVTQEKEKGGLGMKLSQVLSITHEQQLGTIAIRDFYDYQPLASKTYNL